MISVVDGREGGGVGCDCYPGCWGDHSAAWPRLVFDTEELAREGWRLCHQGLTVGEPLPEEDRVPYGSYVLVGKELRFATAALRNGHLALLEEYGFSSVPKVLQFIRCAWKELPLEAQKLSIEQLRAEYTHNFEVEMDKLQKANLATLCTCGHPYGDHYVLKGWPACAQCTSCNFFREANGGG